MHMNRPPRFRIAAPLLLGLLSSTLTVSAADWSTNRGNAARTGAADDRPVPPMPKVLWTHESKEDFIASPVPFGESVLVSGLGSFNTASIYALAAGETATKRVQWSKVPPFLKLPTVSSPAIVDGNVYLGDGMHQTDGASLHCLSGASGRELWRYSIPGTLVHIEGTPTVVGSKVFFGGGNAGVVCLDASRLSLDGKEVSADEAKTALESKWKALVAAYEAELKKDPDFAIPPSEDALPKAAPKLAWQQGAGAWHVDASVAVVGERVLVCTSYLDLEKTGERAVFCLSSQDGKVLWKAPLQLNPWAGVTVSGDRVFVGGSSIRFDPKEIPGAKGDVVCLQLSDGKEVWRRDVPGGVLSSVAATEKSVVFTATDGKIRALAAATGMRSWTYDAQAPLFAAPAVTAKEVYAADLKGVVHAITLSDGKPLWKIPLGAAPVSASGMVFGSPAVAGGRLYVGTCMLEGGTAGQNVVVCIGAP